MDLLFLLLDLLLVMAGLALALVVLLYLIPVRFSVRYVSGQGSPAFEPEIRWAVFCVRPVPDDGLSSIGFFVLGRRLFSVDEEGPSSPDADVPVHRPADIAAARDLVTVVKSLARPAFSIGGTVYRLGRFERCEGTVRIGLGDPAATGMLCGSYWATRFVLNAARIYISMEPVFDREVLVIDLTARFRIDHPLQILLRVARELIRSEVRAALPAFRQAAREMS